MDILTHFKHEVAFEKPFQQNNKVFITYHVKLVRYPNNAFKLRTTCTYTHKGKNTFLILYYFIY